MRGRISGSSHAKRAVTQPNNEKSTPKPQNIKLSKINLKT
jgi:hypothetical protein